MIQFLNNYGASSTFSPRGNFRERDNSDRVPFCVLNLSGELVLAQRLVRPSSKSIQMFRRSVLLLPVTNPLKMKRSIQTRQYLARSRASAIFLTVIFSLL